MELIETPSKTAVASGALAVVLATNMPMYTFCAMEIVCVVPYCVQFTPSGEANVEIRVGGVVVTSGDLVIADEDGIVFCRAEDAPGVITAAREILAEEEAIFRRWDAGEAYLQGLGLSR